MQLIYVVEHENDSRRMICQYLLAEGFQVEGFSMVEEVTARLKRGYPDMFLLEITPPGKDCFEFYREIRKWSGVPVIFMTSRGDESFGVIGLELGGDDYLTKPIDARELAARVRSVFRRYLRPIMPQVLAVGSLKICPADRRVTIEDQEVMLTPKEYELLLLLLQQPQRIFTRQELLDLIWGREYIGAVRSVDDLIKRLRKKLKGSSSHNDIKTIWGRGYRFNA